MNRLTGRHYRVNGAVFTAACGPAWLSRRQRTWLFRYTRPNYTGRQRIHGVAVAS